MGEATPDMALRGKTIVITGAASGIGRALAFGFLAEGAAVLAADISEEGLAGLASRGASTQLTDVAEREQVEALIARAVAETGRIDALFNNAGYGARKRVEDTAPGSFEKMIAVHLFGALHGMRAAIPRMRAQGCGRIINTLSRAAEVSAPGQAAYSSAKAALWALTRAAAHETADCDILVNGLIPGPTNTGIWGRDMPRLQSADAVYPTARLLATLPAGGASGQVFWNEKPYPLMDPANEVPKGL
jgi:NAD(P)-dependent dehydrogenase (short-subunit alcohol dehydrogenase family)